MSGTADVSITTCGNEVTEVEEKEEQPTRGAVEKNGSSIKDRIAHAKSVDGHMNKEGVSQLEIQFCRYSGSDFLATERLYHVLDILKDGTINLICKDAITVPYNPQSDYRKSIMYKLEERFPEVLQYLTLEADQDEKQQKIFIPPQSETNIVQLILPNPPPYVIQKVYDGSCSILRKEFWTWFSSSPCDDVSETSAPKVEPEVENRPYVDGDAVNINYLQLLNPNFSSNSGVDFYLKDIKERLATKWNYTEQETDNIVQGLPDNSVLGKYEEDILKERLKQAVVKSSEELETTLQEAVRLVFPSSHRVSVEKLCGGFSGARVFHCKSWRLDGSLGEPCVVKVDDAMGLKDEYQRMVAMGPILGENAPKVIAMSQVLDTAALRIELCGASWCLPNFSSEKVRIGTFKDLYKSEIARLTPQRKGTVQITQQKAAEENVFGEIETVLGEVFGSILVVGATQEGHVEKKSIFQEGGYDVIGQIKKQILSEDVQADLLRGDTATRLVEQWTGLKNKDVVEFFSLFVDEVNKYHASQIDVFERLVGHIHGDLNGANILIDSETIVWLIDFAFSGKGPGLSDICKMENTILFEYTPLEPNFVEENDFVKLLSAIVSLDLDTLPSFDTLGINASTHSGAILEQAWSAVSRIREHISDYSKKHPNPLNLHVGRLFFALKTLKFIDISLAQKRAALMAALGHAAKTLSLISSDVIDLSIIRRKSFPKHRWSVGRTSLKKKSRNRLQRQRVKYLTAVSVKEAFFIDPVSRMRLSVLDQCVNLKLTDAAENHEDGDNETDMGEVLNSQEIIQAFKAFTERFVDISRNDFFDKEDYIQLLKTTEMENLLELLGGRELFEGRQMVNLFDELGGCRYFNEDISAETYLRNLIYMFPHQNREHVRNIHSLWYSYLDSRTTTNEKKYLDQVNSLFPSDIDFFKTRRLVVIGAAAAGKSVLLRKILVYASMYQSYHTEYCIVPVRVLLIDMGRQVVKHNLTAEDDLLELYFDEKFGRGSVKYDFIKRTMQTGRVLLLFDGFDEAGNSGKIILGWLSKFLERNFEQRVIVSSREVGFAQHIKTFEGERFRTLKIQPLTKEMISLVVTQRITRKGAGASDQFSNLSLTERESLVGSLKEQLELSEYAGLARNPLRLSLLIHVLSKIILEDNNSKDVGVLDNKYSSTSSNSAFMLSTEPQNTKKALLTRAKLFSIAIEQMLCRGDSTKYKRRAGKIDKMIEQDFDLLEAPAAMKILREVALIAHCRNCDITLEVFSEALMILLKSSEDQETNDPIHLKDVFNSLQRTIGRDHVPLFQVRPGKHNTVPCGAMRALMFAHLTLQENLAAQCIAEKLKMAVNTEQVACEYFGGRTLEEPWWHDVFLIVCEVLDEGTQDEIMMRMFSGLLCSSQPNEASEEALRMVYLAISSGGNVAAMGKLIELRQRISHRRSLEIFDIRDPNENNCLHLAAEHNRVIFLKYLIPVLEHQGLYASLSQQANCLAWDPSNMALCKNNLNCFRLLCQTIGDHYLRKAERTLTEFQRHVYSNDILIVSSMLEEDPDLATAFTYPELLPCIWAAYHNNLPMLKLLIEHDPKEEYKNVTVGRRLKVLAFAAENNSLECAKFLIEQGVDAVAANELYSENMSESLQGVAAGFGYDEMVKLFIEAGCSPEEIITITSIQGRDEFISMIFEHFGTDFVNKVTALGVSALACACVAGHTSTAKLLVEAGADMNLPISVPFGSCALHIAVRNSHMDVIKYLLDATPANEKFSKCNVNFASGKNDEAGYGTTPLSIAMTEAPEDKREVLIELLTSHGAKLFEDMTDEEKDMNTAKHRDGDSETCEDENTGQL